MIDFRLADKNDTEKLAELRWEHKNEETPLDLAEKKNFIFFCSDSLKKRFSDDINCWVATDNGEIVSHIYVVVVKKIPKPGRLDGGWGYITAVRTVPEYRNKGIGSMLMDKTKEWGKKQGLELLIVWPGERSVPFYERAGFNGINDILELSFE